MTLSMCQKHSRRDLYFNYITTTRRKSAAPALPLTTELEQRVKSSSFFLDINSSRPLLHISDSSITTY